MGILRYFVVLALLGAVLVVGWTIHKGSVPAEPEPEDSAQAPVEQIQAPARPRAQASTRASEAPAPVHVESALPTEDTRSPEARERWRAKLHDLGFHEEVKNNQKLLDRLEKRDMPDEVKERIRQFASGSQAAPDAGTVTVPFSAVHANCPLLNNYEMKVPALIGIDTNGAITSAAPRFLGLALPDTLYSCAFDPYVGTDGYAQAVVVQYSPRHEFPSARPSGLPSWVPWPPRRSPRPSPTP
jgi:hypothetical protein